VPTDLAKIKSIAAIESEFYLRVSLVLWKRLKNSSKKLTPNRTQRNVPKGPSYENIFKIRNRDKSGKDLTRLKLFIP
jgi:hypothetical protein